MDDAAEVSAFVEVKPSHLGRRTIVRRLADLGDAEAGESVKVGAMAVLIAPVSVGPDAEVGANAVVTEGRDLSVGPTVVGVPSRPLNRVLARELSDDQHDSGA
jgi:bifunctional UDP-N-acetylglucosamine pyrophosphorylase / glucosamine-1-phosphate N-acetyltransferase